MGDNYWPDGSQLEYEVSSSSSSSSSGRNTRESDVNINKDYLSSQHPILSKETNEEFVSKQEKSECNVSEEKQLRSDQHVKTNRQITTSSTNGHSTGVSKEQDICEEGQLEEQIVRMHVTEVEPPLTLKVLSLNMHKDMSVEQQKQLARGGYHIALLQEYCEKEGTPFVNIKEYEEHHTWALKRMRTREQCGTVVLLKMMNKLAYTKGYSFLSPDLEAVIRTPKSMTAVYMEFFPSRSSPPSSSSSHFSSPSTSSSSARKRLLVVSVHGHNGWPWREAKPLERQLLQLSELLTEFQCPAVIAGDFNTFNEPRQEVVFGFMRQNSFTNFNSAVFDATRTLDYVFARGVTIEHFRTLRGLSDHPGMEFSIAL